MSARRLLAAAAVVLVAVAPQCLTTVAYADGSGSSVVAGTGAAGSSGDGGSASAALLKNPNGVAVGPDGTVYISDAGNHRVRAVAPDGTISTVAGTGQPGTGPVPDGGSGTKVPLALPSALAVGSDGTLYIGDAGRSQVLALRPNRKLSVVAGDGNRGFGGDGGPATRARLGLPAGLAVGPDGTVYIADRENNRVRAVSPAGVIRTVAGNGFVQTTSAGGPATSIPIVPNSVAADGAGDVWIAAGLMLLRLNGERLATVTTPGGALSNTWGTAEDAAWPPADPPLNNIAAVAVSGDRVYALDQGGRKVLRLGAGNALEQAATFAEANSSDGPIAATSTALYLVDNGGHRLYRFTPAPAASEDRDGAGRAGWLLPVGAAALVVVLAGGLVVWRRRHGR